MSRLIGLEIDNDKRVAHDTASGEFPLTVPGNGEAEILISASMDYPLMILNLHDLRQGRRVPNPLRWWHPCLQGIY